MTTQAHQTAEGWMETYKRLGALWIADGQLLRPHAKLTSNVHSDGFFNSNLVTRDTELVGMAVDDLLYPLAEIDGVDLSKVDCVVGPALGAIALAFKAAAYINSGRESGNCIWATVAKTPEGTKMVFRTEPEPGSTVLLIEDVVATGESVHMAKQAIEEAGCIMLDRMVALVNRTPGPVVEGIKVRSLIEYPMPFWKADVCPRCAQGSEPLFPKRDGNWARLNAPAQELATA